MQHTIGIVPPQQSTIIMPSSSSESLLCSVNRGLQGYLVNWDLEQEIWSRCFKSVLKVSPREAAGLCVTEPLFNLPQLQAAAEQVS